MEEVSILSDDNILCSDCIHSSYEYLHNKEFFACWAHCKDSNGFFNRKRVKVLFELPTECEYFLFRTSPL